MPWKRDGNTIYLSGQGPRDADGKHITGTVGGMAGGLVLLHDGSFRDGVASASLRVASGTGELSNAGGTGKFRADPAGSITLDLDGVDTAISDLSAGSRQ